MLGPGQSLLVTEPPTKPLPPMGLIWDSTNYSCTYDAIFTPLALPEEARDLVRRVLPSQNVAEFPLGPRGIKLDALFLAVTDRRSYGGGELAKVQNKSRECDPRLSTLQLECEDNIWQEKASQKMCNALFGILEPGEDPDYDVFER
ncbi:hypothetical protein B0H13DRAFT_1873227 [Mycena leptocephala]|nr:hypothetical protein B0H13DRAFT_1873227 [Mycena leptocephala]